MDTKEVTAIGGSFFAIIAYVALAMTQPTMTGIYWAFAGLFFFLFVMAIGATVVYHSS